MTVATKRRARGVGRPPNPPDPVLAERIRSLRQARGLTQAQLADRIFTKGFISLLETGRTGLSLRAARLFAPRLGVTVDDLLRPARSGSERDIELALTRAEAEFASGHHEQALRTAKSAEKGQVELRARYLRLRGRVLLQTERPAEAVATLDEALRLLRRVEQKELAARTLFDLAQAHARSEAFGEAIHYGLQCENAILAGHVVDASLEVRLLSFLAGVFVAIGDLASADLRIERAKRLIDDISEPKAVGNLYFNLAVTRQREGDPEGALAYARKALEAYEQMNIPAYVASVWNTLGWIHTQRREFDRAEEALDRAEQIAKETGDDRVEAYVLQNRAQLALARGQTEDAIRLAQASAEHPDAPRRARAISLLTGAEALARTAASDREVDAAFRAAIAALTPFGRMLLARAHRAHFEALAARGRHGDAEEAARRGFDAVNAVLT